jgi:hypothetical protein
MTNVIQFVKPTNYHAEAELLQAIKTTVYCYAGTLSVAQVLGVLQIVKEEIYGEQL